MPKVEFLVLNAIDYEKLQFVSKSIVHPKHPSSSIFYSGSKTYAKDNSKKRALNTIALKVIKINENNSKLLVLNYVDMGIKKGKGASLYNFINKHFFPSLYKRIKTKYNAN